MSSAEENLSDNEGYKRRRVSRACDSCRKKKIRCDGIQGPGKKCSHCTAFKLNCSYVQTAQRRPPPKSYVAGLEDRLRNMEELLQQMTASGSGPIFTPVSGERVGSSAGSSVGESPQSTSGHRDSPPLGALRARFSPGSLEEAQPSDDEDELIINKINGNFRQLTMQDRFFGKSSGVTLVKTALEYKRGMSVSGPGSKWVIPNGRAEFWVPQTWQSDPESFEWAWPDPDLQQDLIDIFFERQNVTLPLLHRPTFEKLLGQGLHTRSVSFATVVMGVFACASRHSEDTRVLLDGSSSWHSAGWKFYNQIRTDRHLVQCNPSLYDIQAYCLRSLFLQGNSTPQAAWITLSMGLRLAQDLGAHRRIAYGQRPTVEGELLKRAFWILVLLDRLMSAGIGRSCGIYEEDFDLDLPIDCDDEYWSDGFQQPLDKPSLVAAFISSLKLSKVLGFALRSLYSINKSKLFLGLVGADWEQHVAAELDSMLNEWIDSVPSHLRWDPVRPLSKFFVQSANIYSFYYFTQIMVHRPFVTKKGASPALTFPSMAICTNAARSSARLAEVLIRRHYHRVFPGVLQLCGFTSAIILLLNLWQAKRFGISVDADKEMALIRVWMDYAKSLEDRTIMGGRFWDVLNELTNFGDLPTSHFSNSRSTSKRPNSDLDEPSPFQQPLPSQTSTVLTPATNLTVPSRPSSHLSTSVAPSPQFQSTDTGLHTAGASGSDTFGLDSWDTARSSLAGGIGHTAIHASPGLSTLGSGAALGGYHPAAYPLNSTAATPESAALGQNPSISDVNSQASQTFDESFPTEDSQASASEQWPNFLDMVPGTFTHDNNIMSMGMGMMSSLPSNNSAEDWNAYFSTMFNTSHAPTPDWTGHPSSDSTSHG